MKLDDVRENINKHRKIINERFALVYVTVFPVLLCLMTVTLFFDEINAKYSWVPREYITGPIRDYEISLFLFLLYLFLFLIVSLPYLRLMATSMKPGFTRTVVAYVVDEGPLVGFDQAMLNPRAIALSSGLFTGMTILSGMVWIAFPDVTRAEPATFIFGLLVATIQKVVKDYERVTVDNTQSEVSTEAITG